MSTVLLTDLNICVLGDGIASGEGDTQNRGWAGQLVDSVRADHGPLNYYNLGIVGQNSEAVLQRLGELEPRMPLGADNRLILAFGLMDAVGVRGEEPLPAKTSWHNLATLLKEVHGHYKPLLIGPPAVYDPAQNGRIKRINGGYRELCTRARIPYVDLFTSLQDDVQYRRELNQGDRLHPGSFGHRKIFDLVSNDRSWWFG
ncbi:GDSL-type esterase/lipase family protein [Saccharospirillum impatiens]|uniref:GDSL-type esterase/lipase family protein n=1 Tax=Saccharospirillum impatiens TaxID=169438 RepID=UPI0004267DB1|nr:GDSL-type esterase/lipase family protein [Saccharospirillum impatiens]